MKTDTYTKTILTVIAICLVILAAKSFDPGVLVSTAHAETRSIMDVNIARINGMEFGQVIEPPSLNPPAIPVKIREK